MSEQKKEVVKRWTAKRKSAVVLDIIKGLTTPAEVARKHGLTVGEVEGWIESSITAMEERLRSNPREAEARWEAEKKELYAKIGELSLDIDILKKSQKILERAEGDGNS